MNRFRITPIVLLVLLFALVLGAAPVLANTAVQQMAQITMKLNHYPSDAEKQTLRGIADNASATAGERALATALINMEHKVGAADKQKLQELMKSDGASAEERTLAEVLIGINHKPSAADMQKLRPLAGQ
jgi:predicted PurR-regulated permease PerM